jgi:hypothetical protein
MLDCIAIWRIGHRREKRVRHFGVCVGRSGDGGGGGRDVGVGVHVEGFVFYSFICEIGGLDTNRINGGI